MTPPIDRRTRHTVAALLEQLRQIEGARRTASDLVLSSGHPQLDQFLPEGGFRPGTLVEWLAGGRGSGAATLALLAARQAAQRGGAVVVIDGTGRFYPPAAIRLGIDPRQLILVRTASDADHAWALDQSLRAGGVAAVWCCPPVADDHAQRRWQLAAESSGVLGLLVREAAARHEPSWAEVRLGVEPRSSLPGSRRTTSAAAKGGSPLSRSRFTPLADPAALSTARRVRVELLRSRDGQQGQAIELELPPIVALSAVGLPAASAPTVPLVGGKRTRAAALSATSSPASTSGSPSSYPVHWSTSRETRPLPLAAELAAAKTGRRSRGA